MKYKMLKRPLFVIVCSSLLLCLSVSADTKDDEIALLKEQVKQLRSENQALRLQLAQDNTGSRQASAQAPATEIQPVVKQAVPAQQQAEKSYWITTSSSKRHNSSCRYYKSSKGRLCTKDEGVACKICGG